MIPAKKIFLLIIISTCIFQLSMHAQDITPPGRPYITYVTVDTATNNTLIYWEESPSADVEKYYLYYEILTINGWEGIKFDSIYAPAASYVHIAGASMADMFLYSVTAVDSSGNESIRTPGLHRGVRVEAGYDSCDNRIKVSWQKYIGWGNRVSGYRIYGAQDNLNFTLLQGLGAADSIYYHYGISENSYYNYFVEVIRDDGLESMSGIAFKFTYMPGPPETLIAEYASVIDKNIAELSFFVTDTSSITDYALLRSSDKTSDFMTLRTINHVGTGNIITQDTIIANRDRFYYKLGALNPCKKLLKESNLAVNILLKGSASGNTVILNWNPYENFPDGLEEYVIYRKADQDSFLQQGISIPGFTDFTDDITSLKLNSAAGLVHYKVKAVSQVYGFTSLSNEVILSMDSDVLVPNAFTPDGDGINDVFFPVFSFIPEEYMLIIYDRYGLRLFTSRIPETGWDGTKNGKKVGEGVYMYYIEFKSFNGRRRTLTGSVTLFYP